MRTALLYGLLALAVSAHAQTKACGPQTTEVMSVGVSTLCLHIEQASPARTKLLHTWVRRSADIVAQY